MDAKTNHDGVAISAYIMSRRMRVPQAYGWRAWIGGSDYSVDGRGDETVSTTVTMTRGPDDLAQSFVLPIKSLPEPTVALAIAPEASVAPPAASKTPAPLTERE